MIAVRELRRLTLEAGHISAASGLVRAGAFLYVAADDELGLGVFEHPGERPGRMAPVFEGELPAGHAERKAAKPDLEALTLLPGGALLALGSGSTARRERGAVWPLGADGRLRGEPRLLDLSPLYAALRAELPEPNVEGACPAGDRLWLFQRGNTASGENVVVSVPLDDVLAGRAPRTLELRRCELGEGFTFTDAHALRDGRILFAAAAEDTSDPYADGVVTGSAVGVVGAGGAVEWMEALDAPGVKVEGVHAQATDEGIELLLVADADDPAVPAPLLAATVTTPGR